MKDVLGWVSYPIYITGVIIHEDLRCLVDLWGWLGTVNCRIAHRGYHCKITTEEYYGKGTRWLGVTCYHCSKCHRQWSTGYAFYPGEES